MNIYVAHTTKYDFKEKLYKPLRKSKFNNDHEIKLPHEVSGDTFNSKEYLKNADLVIAEVSRPSMGTGIELGWANLYGVKIVCVYEKGTSPTSALRTVSDHFLEYKSSEDLIKKLEEFL